MFLSTKLSLLFIKRQSNGNNLDHQRLESGASIVGAPHGNSEELRKHVSNPPPNPPNFRQTDFPPLNNLNIASPLSTLNGKSDSINFAAALGGYGGSGSRRKIRLPHRSYELKEGNPIVTFSKEENDMLAETCKLTLIGKFTRIRPSIEKIRDDFKKNIQLKGSVKIGAYNLHHVFLDFDLEEDHRSIYGHLILFRRLKPP